MNSRHSKGFTLIELLISMSILMVLLGLAYQSVAIFLKAFSQGDNAFAEAKENTFIELRLGSSIRGMLDYYVLEDGRKQVLFLQHTEDQIEFVSEYSVVFGRKHDVLVRWQLLEQPLGIFLQATECPLSAQLVTQTDEAKFDHPSCLSEGFLLGTETASFEVVEAQSKPDGPLMFGMDLGTFDVFRMPQRISLLLGAAEQRLVYFPNVNNTLKIKQLQSQGLYAF